MSETLLAVADGRIMGEIRRDRGRLTFVYDEDWRSMEGAWPLSLSMPLAVREHEHARIEPWLWGLLPDNESILERWGQRFHVSPRNPFALLGFVGEECAGAVQLVRPDRVEWVVQGEGGSIHWLTGVDLAGLLQKIRENPAEGLMAGDTGQFSLAGAQPKTALFFDGQLWGVPTGATPTTHILKPPMDDLDGHVENEHLCLELARRLGLPAAESRVHRFWDENLLVVTRYDRAPNGDMFRRIHQEDICQVLGLHPAKKYQNEGGPGCADIAGAIRAHSGEAERDVWTFARATMLNWIIGGTDAHAKNFSMLIGAGGRARLAPLYDVASTLPYDLYEDKLKLATRIGGEYRLGDIQARHWERFASEVGLPPGEVLDMGKSMADALPEVFAETVEAARDRGVDHPIANRMIKAFGARAKRCAGILSGHSDD